jgi:hypothetical protein
MYQSVEHDHVLNFEAFRSVENGMSCRSIDEIFFPFKRLKFTHLYNHFIPLLIGWILKLTI